MEKTERSPVAVVVVNFNSGGLLSECLDALMASTWPVEVCVCDNASNDGSLQRAKSHFSTQVHWIENERNQGFAAAVNQGLAWAQCEYVLLLNPDCLLAPDILEQLFDDLRQVPHWGMAGCRILDPDGSEQRGCRRNLPNLAGGLRKALGWQRSGVDLHRTPLPEHPVAVEAISGAFMLCRRAAIADVGPMDEGYFLHCEDLDWCKRFQEAGWPVIFVPRSGVVHHRGSCSRRRPLRVEWHKHRGMWRYYRKFIAPGLPRFMSPVVAGGIAGRFLLQSALHIVRPVPPKPPFKELE